MLSASFLGNYISNGCDVWDSDVKSWYIQIFFFFLKNFYLLCQKLGKKHKWPEMTCNAIHIILCELNIMWLWFLVHWCRMIIYPGIFPIFRKFWFLVQKSVERVKWGLNSWYLCAYHFLVTTSHISMIFGTLM